MDPHKPPDPIAAQGCLSRDEIEHVAEFFSLLLTWDADGWPTMRTRPSETGADLIIYATSRNGHLFNGWEYRGRLRLRTCPYELRAVLGLVPRAYRKVYVYSQRDRA